MGLKPRFNQEAIRIRLEAALKRIEAAIIMQLSFLGEECVNLARNLNTYKNQTGNLRSSIGYVIVKDGRVLKRNFKAASKDEGGTGVRTAEQIALKAITNTDGFGLIVVAGMNYASAVEVKGYDVITSAEHFAQKKLPKIKTQLKRQIQQMK